MPRIETRYLVVEKYEIRAEPLSGEEVQRESTLPYRFDPDHDYTHDVAHDVPPYALPVYERSPLAPAPAFDDQRGTRDVRVGPGRRDTRVQPFIRYVRAVDPSGNICALSVSTCRSSPDPKRREVQTGHDGLGTEVRVPAEKRRRGWLIAELGEVVNGLDGQRYLAWVLAVAEKRRLAHAAYEEREADPRMSSVKRRAEAREDRQEMVGDIVAATQAGTAAGVVKALKDAGMLAAPRRGAATE